MTIENEKACAAMREALELVRSEATEALNQIRLVGDDGTADCAQHIDNIFSFAGDALAINAGHDWVSRAELRKTQDELMGARDDYFTARLEQRRLRAELEAAKAETDQLGKAMEAIELTLGGLEKRHRLAERQRCAEIVRQVFYEPIDEPEREDALRRILENQ